MCKFLLSRPPSADRCRLRRRPNRLKEQKVNEQQVPREEKGDEVRPGASPDERQENWAASSAVVVRTVARRNLQETPSPI